MKIYLDFDGTVVEHAYPAIGRAVPHAMRVLEELSNKGHEIVLNTMRCEEQSSASLNSAREYIEYHPEHIVKLADCTKNKIYPANWGTSVIENVIFIDDSAYGTPLIPSVYDGKMMVDWLKVEEDLKKANIL